MRKAVITLSTYPIFPAVHGGQRRLDQISRHYQQIGLESIHACILVKGAEKVIEGEKQEVFPVSNLPSRIGAFLTDDILLGEIAAQREDAYDFFSSLVKDFDPVLIHLEQPFLFPLLKRMKAEGVLENRRVIFSSQNVEGPLKRSILEGLKFDETLIEEAVSKIRLLEERACSLADLILCVTKADAEYHRSLCGSSKPVLVIRNGVERRIFPKKENHRASQQPFLYYVGSGHPPNITGFTELVLSEGPYFCPPVISIKVCGGCSDGIWASESYQRYRAAGTARLQFLNPISDEELTKIMDASLGAILPVRTSAGSNLKTAEALALGKWVVASDIALRGFEEFRSGTNVVIANDHKSFRQAIARALREPPLPLTEEERNLRDAVYWDRSFSDGGFEKQIRELL